MGDYFDAANVEHGFVSSGGTFTAIDFGATRTLAAGINATGDIVGVWSDASGTRLSAPGRRVTPINFPLATSTTAIGISDTAEIAGLQRRRRQQPRLHLHAVAPSAPSTLQGPGTQLTRIKNGGQVTGVCTDALTGQHGITGQ